MRSLTGSRLLAAALIVMLVFVAGVSAVDPAVLAQDGTPAVENQPFEEPAPEEEPPAELPTETSAPEPPTEVPPPTETATLEPTVPVEIPATETPIELTLEPSATIEPSATTEPSPTATEAVDPAAIGTGTLVINVFDEPGVPSTYTDMDILLNSRPAGGSDPNADITFQADGPTITRTNIPEGRYGVYVFGSEPVTGPVTIQPGQTTEVDVILEETVARYTVTFGVDWLDGSASNDAEVCFGPDGCPAYSNPQGEYSTGPSWHLINGYSMYLPGGEYTFYFRAPGRNVTSVTRVISEDTTVIGALSIRSLGDYGNLDIQVQTDSGQPIPAGYTLSVEGLGNTAYYGEPSSQQIPNLLPGWYSVTLSGGPNSTPGSGYQQTVSQNVYVAAGVVNYTRLILRTTYRAQVTFDVAAPGIDPNGWNLEISDAAGNHVVGTGFFATAGGMQGQLTLESGSYTYRIGANAGDRLGTTGSFTVGGSNLTVPVSMPAASSTQRGSVTIHVVTDEGADVHGLEIVDPNGFVQYTDGAGLATFSNVLEGPTRFSIKNRTGEEYSVVVNVTAAGPNVGVIEIPHVAVSQTGTVVFQIYLSDGSPATLAEYGAVLFDLRGVGQSTVSTANSNTITFTYVPQGFAAYKIFAEHAFQDYQENPLAYNSWQTLSEGSVSVVAGETTTVQITLPKTPTTVLTPVPTATATSIPSSTPTRTPSPTRTPTVPSGTPHTMSVTFAGCTPGTGSWYVRVQATSNALPNSVTFNFAGGATANATIASQISPVSGGFQAYYYANTNPADTIQSVMLYLPTGATPIGANVTYAGGLCSGGAMTATASPTATNTIVQTQTATATPTNTVENTTTTTPENTATATVTNTATATSTPSRTATTLASSTPTATVSPSVTPGAPTIITTANVNCRTGGGTSFFSLGVVARNTTLPVRGATVGGWTPVICFGQNGWISSSYLEAGPSATATVPSGASMRTTARVNCRTGASTANSIIGLVPNGATLQLRGSAQNGWYPVVCFGQNGWISGSYLNPAPTATATVPSGPTAVTTTRVNCRTAPTTSQSNVITVLASGVTVPVRGAQANGWTPVTCSGQSGWIASRYLTT